MGSPRHPVTCAAGDNNAHLTRFLVRGLRPEREELHGGIGLFLDAGDEALNIGEGLVLRYHEILELGRVGRTQPHPQLRKMIETCEGKLVNTPYDGERVAGHDRIEMAHAEIPLPRTSPIGLPL